MFSVGDLVVHPMHGAGVIDAVVQEKVSGVIQDYYVFRRPAGDLVLKIPVAKSESIGLRALITPEEVETLLSEIPRMQLDKTINWNKRYRDNLEKLKSGDPYQVALVIKGLMRREKSRGLSTGERKMLHSARQILLSELVLSLDRPSAEIEKLVDAAMLRPAPKTAAPATPAAQ